jgi:hypothetical protein
LQNSPTIGIGDSIDPSDSSDAQALQADLDLEPKIGVQDVL